jgi:hypothetical protein
MKGNKRSKDKISVISSEVGFMRGLNLYAVGLGYLVGHTEKFLKHRILNF